jgi:CRP/FNR family transcriptional regulator
MTPSFLQQYPLLDAFDEEALYLIMPLVHIQNIHKDYLLFSQGDSSDKLYFVVEGWFKAEKIAADGRQTTLRFIGPGELINELSVFSKIDNEVSVVAMEDAKLFYFSQHDVEQWLKENSNFSRAVIARQANRIQHLLGQIEDLSLHTVDVRLARFLLAQAENDVWVRQSWITQTEIAARLGTVLDVVNRNLQKLVRDGLIEISRDKITIVDRERLEAIAHS